MNQISFSGKAPNAKVPPQLLLDLETRLDHIYRQDNMDILRVIKNMFRLFIALDEHRVLLRILSNPGISLQSKQVLLHRLLKEPIVILENGQRQKFNYKTEAVPSGAKVIYENDLELEKIMLEICQVNLGSEDDFLTALEDIAIDGVLHSAQQDDRLDFVEAEMYDVLDLLTKETDLNKVLSDFSIPRRRRLKLIDVLFRDKVDRRTFALLKHATAYIARGRFWGNVYWMCELISNKKHKIVAHVTSAHAFSAEQRRRLLELIQSKYSRNVELAISIDPELIGGARMQIDSDFVDTSVRAKLQDYQAELRVGI
jgi:F-type H+-transporting ATPase subunit delta